MSYSSINKNKLAKEEIKKAMSYYHSSLSAIEVGNNNEKTNEIINLIELNKKDLEKAVIIIDDININISNKLYQLSNKEQNGSD